MYVNDIIKPRLSIRRYAEGSVSDNNMEILFKALQLGPSVNNYQNREFIFVGDPDLKEKLTPACLNQKFVNVCLNATILKIRTSQVKLFGMDGTESV